MNEEHARQEELLGRIVSAVFVACLLVAFLWGWLAGG